jgi:hypothetical protein
MTRTVLAGLALAAVFGAGAWGGWAASQGRCAAAVAASQRALIRAGELATQKELQRLAAEAEREKIARELEDMANAEPVTTVDCLPVSRVRRLNRF